MTDQSRDIRAIARSYCTTAAAGFSDLAEYLRSINQDIWNGPSSCTKWTVHDLAAHAAGEAIWFPNLMRGVTQNEEPLPMSVYDELKSYTRDRIASTLDRGAAEFKPAIESATDENLRHNVDLGFAKQPLWQATYVSAFEASFHGWDARAAAETDATIPREWAVSVAQGMVEMAPVIAHQSQLPGASGTYLLRVGDGVGPVSITVRDGALSVAWGETGTADITLGLTADQYVRLMAGRLKLDSNLPRDQVSIDGNRTRASALNRVFGGVANAE